MAFHPDKLGLTPSQFSSRLLRGEINPSADREFHPMKCIAPLEEFQQNVGFIASFANVTAIDTKEGIVLIDAGGSGEIGTVFEEIKKWRPSKKIHTIIYTHGHVDHVMGAMVFEKKQSEKIQVIGHKNVARRFNRYKITRGYNSAINFRQFPASGTGWAKDYRYPDIWYADKMELTVGDEVFELFHDKGETDDSTWIWMPNRRIVFAGDLFIWASPNCGNPQKVQRWPKEWAVALRKMLKLTPESLVPGHGPLITGADLVQRVLDDTARYLDDIVDQVLRMMNQGLRLNEILHKLKIPTDLLTRPYLMPLYDEPHFIARNVWRLYGGWYDGNPAHLKPAGDKELSLELCHLIGGTNEAGAEKLAERAIILAQRGEKHDLAIACHLVEFARSAFPKNDMIRKSYITVYGARGKGETSTMARNIFKSAARFASKPSLEDQLRVEPPAIDEIMLARL